MKEFYTFILTVMVNLTMVSCHFPNADARYASNHLVNRIAGYVTCTADTIRLIPTTGNL